MKRYTGVRVLTQALLDCDLAIYIGEGICKEAYPYRQHDNNLYLSDREEGMISFALGIAMGTDKRVFIFCEDQYFIRNMSEIMQAGVSNCKNFFMVLLINGKYSEVPNMPTIFDSVGSQHGIFYNMGLLTHDYSKFFKLYKNPITHIKQFWERSKGPIAIMLPAEPSKKEMPDIELSSIENMDRTKEFIRNTDIKGHNYVPPFSLEDINLEV